MVHGLGYLVCGITGLEREYWRQSGVSAGFRGDRHPARTLAGDFICCHAAEFVRCGMRHPDVKYKDRRLNYSPHPEHRIIHGQCSFIVGTVLQYRMDLLS